MNPLIIFDCDGVLVDSELIASTVFAEYLTLAGYPHTPSDCLTRFTGFSLESCKSLIESQTGEPLPPDFFTSLQRDTFKRFSDELQPVPGVVSVLEFVRRQGWLCCVASSGGHDKMAVTLEKTGLQMYFGGRIFSAVDVQYGKPAPDLFLYAADALGYEPQHCIVVEDARPGVLAALAAGMQVCAFGACHDKYADAQLFTCMSELPSLLMSMREQMFRHEENQ